MRDGLMIGALAALGTFINGLGVVGTFPTDWLNYGLLGLCGFMIWRADTRQQSLINVIDNQNADLKSIREQLIRVLTENSAAACKLAESSDRLADALNERPCMTSHTERKRS